MRTININSGETTALEIQLEAAEIAITGDGNMGEIRFSYGYFVQGRETLDEEAMRPELHVGDAGGPLVLRQTSAQIARAQNAGAHLRLIGAVPRGMVIQHSRIESGTLFLNQLGGVDVSLNSGTIQGVRNSGRQKASVHSGTLQLSGFTVGFHHVIMADSGTITLEAGALLSFVHAEVEQGVIQGAHAGRLERLGDSGWRLVPFHMNTNTSLHCRVRTGTILLQDM